MKARLGWKGLKAEEYVDDGYALLSTPNIKGREIDFENVNFITRERYVESPEIMLREGDVLLTKDGFTLGTTNVVRRLPRPTTLNGSIALIRPKPPLNSVFLYYLLASDFFQYLVHLMKDGMDILHLFQADLRHFDVLLPPLSEQAQIASFLDQRTAAIHSLIAKKERLIELLQDERQALITQAVTKGLDPNVPMRDSGVSWLGVIPASWDALPLRRLITRIEQGWSPSCDSTPAADGAWGVLKAGCTAGGVYQWAENKALPPSEMPRTAIEVHPGDLIMSRASGSPHIVGSCATVTEAPVRLMLSDKHFRLRVEPLKAVVAFLCLALGSRPARCQIEVSISGAEGLANNLPQSELKSVVLAMPPVAEQQAIAAFLYGTLARHDDVVRRLTLSAERLREYRQALITAAVTGKIDVSREAA